MKFRAKIKIVGTDHWYWETLQVNTDNPRQHVLDTLERFNNTLRPGEQAREYGGFIKIIDKRREHVWEKSNLVTIEKRGQMYDTYRCTNCSVTAKRYGIGGPISIDRKYKAKKWERCNG